MYQATHNLSYSDLIKIQINVLALPNSKVNAGFLHRCLQIKPQLNSYHIKPWTQHGDHTQPFYNTPTNSVCRMWRHHVRLSCDITTCPNVGSVCDCRDTEKWMTHHGYALYWLFVCESTHQAMLKTRPTWPQYLSTLWLTVNGLIHTNHYFTRT